MLNLTSAQLRQAANIKDQIATLEKQLATLVGSESKSAPATKLAKKGGMSAAGRASQSAKMKAYWAAKKAAKTTPKAVVVKPTKKKFKMSAAAKAKISAAAKARWAVKKAGKK